MSHDIYLVGSVPLASAEDVFKTVAPLFGDRLKRIPDGETGKRLDWITWLEPVFSQNPALELSDDVFRLHETARPIRRYGLRPGYTASDVKIDNLFYADIAKESYAVFKRLKDAGTIPAGTRFQVDLVPAHSVIWLFLTDALHAAIDPIYNAAVKREIDKIAAAIPHDELAIQFDVASAVFARLQREQVGSYGRSKAEMQETFSNILIDLGNHVPPRYRAALPPVLRRLQSSPCGRAHRHGRHGRVHQPGDAADQPAGQSRAYAGAARSCR